MTYNKTRKNIVILGSTGSIGTSTLEIIAQFPDRFEVLALGAGKNIELIVNQVQRFHPRYVVVQRREDIDSIVQCTKGFIPNMEIMSGQEGYCYIASHPQADVVVSAIVGAAGLIPTHEAVKAGKIVALANKETLVVAGEIITREAKIHSSSLLPVDSEHNAIFQSLRGHRKEHVKRLLLTASGGPFFKWPRSAIEKATPDQALKHPNWSMGAKITIDSATLMNKGLELIEARWLFDIPIDRIDIVIHPESIVHSMVEYIDGSVIAQMAIPDMRIPIAYALSFPDRLNVELPKLDLIGVKTLSFFAPDEERFPCLRLARESCIRGGTFPAVLNAANELAVEAFLNRRIGFYDIPLVIEKTLERHNYQNLDFIENVLEADMWARKEVEYIIEQQSKRRY